MLSLDTKFPRITGRPDPLLHDQSSYDVQSEMLRSDTIALQSRLSDFKNQVNAVGGVEGGAVIVSISPGEQHVLAVDHPKKVIVTTSGIGASLIMPTMAAVRESGRQGDLWFIANVSSFDIAVANSGRAQQGLPIAPYSMRIYSAANLSSNHWLSIGPIACALHSHGTL